MSSRISFEPSAGQMAATIPVIGSKEWVPSMFTVRVQDDAGQWIIYNSYTGAVGAIPKDKETEVLGILRSAVTEGDSSLINDLARKGFIVPKGADEKRRAAYLKHKRQTSQALQLILMPTEECNFRCVYCYEDFARGAMRRSVREGLKNMAAKTIPHLTDVTVGWFGGEPMEALDILEELSQFMLGICRAHGVNYSSNIVTNGYHLTPEKLKRLLLSEVRRIQVTLDGGPEEHDCLRVSKEGSPTFDVIWKNLKAIKKVQGDFNVVIRINFNNRTLETLEPLLSMIASEFQDDPRFSVFFRPLGFWGGPNDGNFSVCDQGGGETAILTSARKAVGHGLRVANLHTPLAPNGMVCYAANAKSFVIGSDGTIYKCTVALDKDFNKVGRLLPTGEMEINQDRFALWVTSDDSDDKTCQSCFYRPSCQGAACPLIRINTGERPCPPEKKRIRQTLLAVWDHYKKFGKLEGGLAASANGPLD